MTNVIAQSTTSTNANANANANATMAMVSEFATAMPAVSINQGSSTVTTHTVSATAKAADLAFTSTQKTLELLTHKREAWEQGAHRYRFESLQHASRVIGDWIGFYNHQRPHQALGMKTPAEAYALAA